MLLIKYALISDIHGNYPALEAVIRDAIENHVDHYVFLGDYSIGLAYPNEVMNSIRSIESSYVVSGNEDEFFANFATSTPEKWPKGQYEAGPWFYKELSVRNRSYLCGLPQEIIIKNDNRPPVFAFHKPQRYFSNTGLCSINPLTFAMGVDEKRFDSKTYDTYFNDLLNSDTELHSTILKMEQGVYVFGHTHIPLCWEREGRLLINPGSCGLPLDFNRDASYGILEWTGSCYKSTLRRVAYDVNATIDYTKESIYSKEVKVWSGIITKELETAREHAIPFIRFVEKYATDIHDEERPFCASTWYSAYEAWCKR